MSINIFGWIIGIYIRLVLKQLATSTLTVEMDSNEGCDVEYEVEKIFGIKETKVMVVVYWKSFMKFIYKLKLLLSESSKVTSLYYRPYIQHNPQTI